MAMCLCGIDPCICVEARLQALLGQQMAQQFQQNALNAWLQGLAQHRQQALASIYGTTQAQALMLPLPEPLENAGIKVEDLIGWRIWQLTPSGLLKSFSAENIWEPGVPMEGNPGDHDSQGVWAFKDEAAAAAKLNQCTRHVMGRVRLWGHVVEHTLGYRAQFARIVSLDVVHLAAMFPWEWKNRKALRWLRRKYGVPDER